MEYSHLDPISNQILSLGGGSLWYSVLSNNKCCRSSDGRLKRVDFVLAWDTNEPEVSNITTMIYSISIPLSIPIPMGSNRGIKHYNNGLHNTNTNMNTNGTPMNQRYWTLQQWSTQYQYQYQYQWDTNEPEVSNITATQYFFMQGWVHGGFTIHFLYCIIYAMQ